MELSDFPATKPSPSHPHQPQRSILAIDLNEVPSFSETLPSPTSLVRSIHDNPSPAEGLPAEIPDDDSPCSGCNRPLPKAAGERLVCDGCERAFHFGCASVTVALIPMMEEWVCRGCAGDGVRSRRWPLGRKKEGGVRLLDMNASPPSDGDGELLGNGASVLRKHSLGEDALHGYTSGGPLLYSNFIYSSNGFGLHKEPGLIKHTMRLDFQDILRHRCSTARSFEDIAYSSHLGKSRSSNTTFRFASRNPSEILQSPKEFVCERHEILEEGWHSDLKPTKNSLESHAVYRSHDGNTFETMSAVSGYVGLASNGTSVEPEARGDDGSMLRQNGLHFPKRRKLSRLPMGNGFTESSGNLICGFNNGFPSNLQSGQFSFCKPEKLLEVTESVQEENGADDHQFHEGLPLQYEDFFVLSLGRIDARASYHDASQIWPVGYRSCWHDKITGSLFLCDVLDGDETAPVFKVRRFSCSALPIPYGSTVLQRGQSGRSDFLNKGRELTTSDDDCYIEMLLSDSGLPVEGDALSWLLSSPNEGDGRKESHSNSEVYTSCEMSHDALTDSSPVGENIGEFSVDGRSASVVWSTLSQKLADACCQVYKKLGSLKFFCKHVEDGAASFHGIMHDKNISSLDKFCSLLGSPKIPSVVKDDEELDSTMEALKNWMNMDRFGFDVEFVQELIEQCPEAYKCSQYEHLRIRNDYSRLPLVGNGLLLINGKHIDQCQEDAAFDGLYREYKAKRKPTSNNHIRPPGKHLGVKLPPHLVGDVVQVWELLCRFHEILCLEPLGFDKLEAELISPWFKMFSDRGSCESDFSDGQICADGSHVLSEATSSSSSEAVQPEENRFIKMESAVKREGNIGKALSTHNKCACVSLKRAHISLLDVLVCELQIKVAAVVDPSIDGESKSRRGRRRDVDTSILAIRQKLNLLPINELTWPELARRYILAVLSMDGNVDSAETGVREYGKVFRCLQGDGGVLCGSLVGLAGIEADAQLLADAIKRIYGSLSCKKDHLMIDDDDSEPVGAPGRTASNDVDIPDWAQALEPVRKLPTNVGTRIRNCVYEALEKNPPDWARKILEHSISKEVYKGNASGPTKKAVLSVLAEGSQQKTRKERKKKTIILPDIIMKQCRILLRRAASADEDRIFCNLLGTNLLNCSENDEEGLLGSPAMVARPLDFRTIDLRLAVGAYGGSHEAFLEDVRELWKNIRIAHSDQPELVQLAETLSQNFESLYEEVISLVDKLRKYSEMEEITTEVKKEIEDVITSTNEIPKAPWDEGVCKVCGIDKDDDSVLLCDACDAEYHTYCLNPPLGRIPEGNWYCPSCVSGVNMLEGSAQGAQFIGQRQRRKYHGEGIRMYLEELGRLASVMERKEYWEFNVNERISLLKFLCDEVLNSILIRQHLEQSFETSADLQQKLRLLHSEWKSLKSREDVLATKAAKLGLSVSNIAKESNGAVTDAVDSSNKNGNTNHLDKDVSCSSEFKQPIDLDCQDEDTVEVVNGDVTASENHDLEQSSKRHKASSMPDSSLSTPLLGETSGIDNESCCQGTLSKADDLQAASGSSSPSNELRVCKLDLISIQKDLSSIQQSITSSELQLLKSSVRMEFLGCDSSDRLYWVSARPVGHPWVIVDGSMTSQHKIPGTGYSSLANKGSFCENLTRCAADGHLALGGSNAACPFVYRPNGVTPSWIFYESDSEIEELMKSLIDTDPKERELKDSIMHWQRLRLQDLHQSGQEHQSTLQAEESDMPNLVTKAVAVLEHKYGPFRQSHSEALLKKRGKRSKVVNDEKMYRCKCLEPVWLSRHHCLSCHRTFLTAEELEQHSDGNCSDPSLSWKRKTSDESSQSLGNRKSEIQQQVQTDKLCPYKFEEISSKFVTNDSIKELVQGIGLIGLEGSPSFVSSVSPYLMDPKLAVLPQEDQLLADDKGPSAEKVVGHNDQTTSKDRVFNGPNICPRKAPAKKHVHPLCAVPQCSLRPLVGRAAQILQQLKINLLDMEAALPEEAYRIWKIHSERRRFWHSFVKAAETIFEMVQATIVLEDMIKSEYLKNEWWYWSSLSAAAKTSTLSSLALRIYALDNAILYERTGSDPNRSVNLKTSGEEDHQSPSNIVSSEKSKQGRRANKKRKEAEG